MASLIGSRVSRIEDDALLRGRGRFVDDIAVPGVLHVAFVRSPHPHALIRSVAKSRRTVGAGRPRRAHARRSGPGLGAAAHAAALEFRHAARTGLAFRARRRRGLLCGRAGRARDRGRPLSSPRMLPRWSRWTTRRSRRRRIAATRCSPTRRRSAASSRPMSSPPTGSASAMPAAAFGQAAHVLHEDFWQHRGAAHSIEGRGIAVEFHSADGSLTVWASTQKAHDLRQSLTMLLDIEENRSARGDARCRRRLWSQALRLSRGCRRGGGGQIAQALAQMDRGPARAFHQCGAGARPVLVDRDRGRCARHACSAFAAACCTISAPMRCRTSTCPTIRPPR